jgi:hypothetical protein
MIIFDFMGGVKNKKPTLKKRVGFFRKRYYL